MKVIIEDLAKKCLNDIFYYNFEYSMQNAIDIDSTIMGYIANLADFPYIGRYIPELWNKHFREIIYRKSRKIGYYYVSEKSNTAYVFYIINCKQDFNKILQSHNYFINYFNF